jgi:tetratricopeptide (TPR) repeat protein
LIFYDVADIEPGEQFPQRLRDALNECEIVLAVIDPEWVDERHSSGPRQGLRRLEDPSDWVRIELATALNDGKLVVPLLAYHDKPPLATELPEILRGLASLQAQRLRQGRDGQHDFEHLAQFLAAKLGVQLSPPLQPVFSVLPRRNPFFSGRENELRELAERIGQDGIAVLSGLGGMGKTDTAVEYAYRHAAEYRVVLWMTADTEADLEAGFCRLARQLNLPQQHCEDEQRVVEAVQQWLASNDSWLLLFDNADTGEALKAIGRLLPSQRGGHVLITSRQSNSSSLGVTNPVTLRKLGPNDAYDFLRHRTGRPNTSGDELRALVGLAEDLGYLPLALEQAATYIKDREVSFANYLVAYQQGTARVRQQLLEKMPPQMGDRERRSLAVTWLLNFEEIESCFPASADLLRFIAFIAADDIPFELILDGAQELGSGIASALQGSDSDPLALHELLAALRRYSLVDVDDAGRTMSVHRLVQLVVQANLDDATRRRWAERAVLAVNAAFPYVEFANWPRCRRLLPHVRQVAKLVNAYSIDTPEAGRLLNEAGYFQKTQGRYAEAERLYQRAIRIRRKALGPEHPAVAQTLSNLALLHHRQFRYRKAERLYRRALEIRRKSLGPNDPGVATVLNNLGGLYRAMRRYRQAESLFLEALAIFEIASGSECSGVAQSLNNLGGLYRLQGELDRAEPLLRRALEIREKELGPDHPTVARSLSNLALLYVAQKRFGPAEELYVRAIRILEDAFEHHHVDAAEVMANYSKLLRAVGREDDAAAMAAKAEFVRSGAGHADERENEA